MENLKELKNNLAKINFKVKVKKLGSLGKCLIFTDIKGNEFPSIFSNDTLQYWDKLIQFKEQNKNEILSIQKQIRY